MCCLFFSGIEAFLAEDLFGVLNSCSVNEKNKTSVGFVGFYIKGGGGARILTLDEAWFYIFLGILGLVTVPFVNMY